MNEEQVCKPPGRRSRQEVEQLVTEYESSGLSRNAFCQERGLSLSTLNRHRRQRQPPAVGNAFLPVEVSTGGSATVAGIGSALAVVLGGGRRIEVGRGFDPSSLEQVVRLLERV